MGGASARRKGHQFERDVVNLFKRAGYDCAQRILEYQEGVGHDVEAGPFRIQCKSYKDYAPISKINEVRSGTPLLVTKGDRKPPIVALYLSDFLKILSDVGEAYDHIEPRAENFETGLQIVLNNKPILTTGINPKTVIKAITGE